MNTLERSTNIDRILAKEDFDIDEYWDAVFPNKEWCEKGLSELGFTSHYDELTEIIVTFNENTDWPEIPEEAIYFRQVTEDEDCLEHDQRAFIVTALRYRKWYLTLELHGAMHDFNSNILYTIYRKWYFDYSLLVTHSTPSCHFSGVILKGV